MHLQCLILHHIKMLVPVALMVQMEEMLKNGIPEIRLMNPIQAAKDREAILENLVILLLLFIVVQEVDQHGEEPTIKEEQPAQEVKAKVQ